MKIVCREFAAEFAKSQLHSYGVLLLYLDDRLQKMQEEVQRAENCSSDVEELFLRKYLELERRLQRRESVTRTSIFKLHIVVESVY